MNKEDLYLLLIQAKKNGITMKMMSAGSGVPYNSIRTFKNSLHLGFDLRKKLGKWIEKQLEKENRPKDQPVELSVNSIFDLIGKNLRDVAAGLEDRSLSYEYRFSLYKNNIDYFLNTLPEIEAEVQRVLDNQDSDSHRHPQRNH